MAQVCGLDPSGGRGPSGYAVLKGSCHGGWIIAGMGSVGSLFTALSKLSGCIFVGVDAPLTLPYRGFRAVERRASTHLGARLLPGGLPGMRRLAEKGFSSRMFFEEAGVGVVETHPGTVAKLSGYHGPRDDSYDAVLAAGVAAAHYCGLASYVIDVDGMLVFARVEVRSPRVMVYGVE